MTAMSSRLPLRSAAASMLLADSRTRHDRPIVVTAIAVAAVAHLIVLVVPLPESPETIPTPTKAPTLSIRRVEIPPPPPPEQPEVPARSKGHRTPLPMEQELDERPVEEPREVHDAEMLLDPSLLEIDPTRVAGPPTVPGVVEDHQEGLIRPVREPGAAKPTYPEMAARVRREGKVILRARINVSGNVEAIEVLRAPVPDLGFSDAAIDAVAGWRYTPGVYLGRPVAVNLTVVVDFYLDR